VSRGFAVADAALGSLDVNATPVGLKDEAVLRHIRRSRFRPVLENGAVIVGKTLAIQVKFRYLPAGAADGDNAN